MNTYPEFTSVGLQARVRLGVVALTSAGAARPKPSCSARTASSVYFAATRQLILISLVEIAWMLIPSSAKRRNIFAATPACERIPSPTIEIFTTSSS